MSVRDGKPEWGPVPPDDGQAAAPDEGVAGRCKQYKWSLAAVGAAAALAVLASVTFRGGTRTHIRRKLVLVTPNLFSRTRSTTPPPTTTTTLPGPQIGNETCLSIEGCPDRYPLPYSAGEWPQEYRYSGSFPEDFAWGVGTASYQVEGAYREDGRGASIWDTFSGADTLGMPGANCSYCCKQRPCPISPAMGARGATGNVASDHYHMLGADVALMKSMGLRHYRFSIAWPRIVPTGRSADGVSEKGVAFYNNTVNRLLAAGIEPHVALYHWDLPQGLFDPPHKRAWWARDDTTGEPTPEIQEEFLAFADVCFKSFGDRVKYWFTFSEPWSFTYLASGQGKAPCHTAIANQRVDPYIAGHNVLNAHAAAVDLYRRKYKPTQGGKIGIALHSDWHEPKTDDPKDVAAAGRAMSFNLGWYADPIFGGKGDYPPAMRRAFGTRLPSFTAEQRRLINGSADFFALSHYGTSWSSYAQETLRHGQPGFSSAGWGLRKLLNWVHNRYAHPTIYLTGGGWSTSTKTAEESLQDMDRVLYYANYTSEMLKAMTEDGVDVRGYFAWSLMDGFHWERGYYDRSGIVFNDYAMGFDPHGPIHDGEPTTGHQVRTRKRSSCWFEDVWTSNTLVDPMDKAFKGCATGKAFRGQFTDPAHPQCLRHITVGTTEESGHVIGSDNSDGCNGRNDKLWGPLRASFRGDTILVDFSPKGGPSRVAGFWNRATESINWADGSSWTRLRNRGVVVA